MGDAYIKTMEKNLSRNGSKLRRSITYPNMKSLLDEANDQKWISQIAYEHCERTLDRNGSSDAAKMFFDEFKSQPSKLPEVCRYLWMNNLEAAAKSIDEERRYAPNERAAVRSMEASESHPLKAAAAAPCQTDEEAVSKRRQEFARLLYEVGQVLGKPQQLKAVVSYFRSSFPDRFSVREAETISSWEELVTKLEKVEVVNFRHPQNLRGVMEGRVCGQDRERLFALLDAFQGSQAR